MKAVPPLIFKQKELMPAFSVRNISSFIAFED